MARSPLKLLSPDQFSPTVALLFEELTSRRASEPWGLIAAIEVVRLRRANGRSPSFSELFERVCRYPSLPPVDWTAIATEEVWSFRHHLAVHWRRENWITWSRTPRSLTTGWAFRRAKSRRKRESAPLTDTSHTTGRPT